MINEWCICLCEANLHEQWASLVCLLSLLDLGYACAFGQREHVSSYGV